MKRREFLIEGGRAAFGFGALSLGACFSYLTKMLADPSGPAPKMETIWPDFAKRFFAV